MSQLTDNTSTQSSVDGQGNTTVAVTTVSTNANNDVVVTEVDTTVTDSQGQVDQIATSVEAPSTAVSVTATANTVVVGDTSAEGSLMAQIAALEANISCAKVQHLGSLNDYKQVLLTAQQVIANAPNGNIALNLDVAPLANFAQQADAYSALLEQITSQFSSIATIDDTAALTAVRDQLLKISNMYDNIHKFHETIVATATLQVPQSIETLAVDLQGVLDALDCSLPYLEHFVGNDSLFSEAMGPNAALSADDQAAIAKAEAALNAWAILVQNEAQVFSNNDPYVIALKSKINAFQQYADRLAAMMNAFNLKMQAWGLHNFI